MSPRLVLQSGAIAAFAAALLLAFQVVIAIGIGNDFALFGKTLDPQQIVPFFHTAGNAITQLMAADDGFAITYALAFAALAFSLMARARALATTALVFALLTALTDLAENSLTLTAVRLVAQKQTLDANILAGLFWLGQMKYLAIYLAALLFAIGVWEMGRAGKIFAVLLLLFPLVGIPSIAIEGLVLVQVLWMFVLLLAGGVFMLRAAQSA